MLKSDRLRILHVIPTYLPATVYGGPLLSVHSLCRHLAERGHDVQVFTTNVDGPGETAVPLETTVDLDGVAITYFSTRQPGRRVAYAPAMGRWLAKHVPNMAVLHVHAVFSWPTYAATRLAAKARVPYLVSPKGSLVPALIRGKNQLLKEAWLRLVDAKTLAGAAYVQPNSQHEYECMQQLGIPLPEVCVIPNGVELPPPADSNQLPHELEDVARAPYAIYLGRISWEKGIERLIAALHGTQIRLIIAGDGSAEYREHLEKQISALGLRENVLFVGAVHGSTKWALLRRARFLALASYSESFGNVVAEAMAVGCPVVVAPEVGARDVVRQSGGGIVAEATPETFRRAMLEVWDDPQTRNRMGNAGAQFVRENLSWERVAETTERWYREAITRCARTR
jgi:glycosyltransferase involved in cell wall biosynthesis